MYVQLKVFVTYLSILFQIYSCHSINVFLRNICTVFLTLCHNTFICSDALPDTSYILADITLLYLPFYVKISEDSNKKWVDRLHRLPMKKLSINFLFHFHSFFFRYNFSGKNLLGSQIIFSTLMTHIFCEVRSIYSLFT